jgi:hypothetical protein
VASKKIYIDFEYHSSEEEHPELISVAWAEGRDAPTRLWLYRSSKAKAKLKEILSGYIAEGAIFVAYNATAEARCFLALGIDPIKLKWIDIYLEYRCLTNHNDELMYGRQLIDGKFKVTKRPKRMFKSETTAEDKDEANSSKPKHNLLSAAYKLLNLPPSSIDIALKEDTRDIILSKDDELINENMEKILEYNESDILYLADMLEACFDHYHKLLKDSDEGKKYYKSLASDVLRRGEYAARTAKMESIGYPINVEATKNFSDSVNSILWQAQDEINTLFPRIKPFRKNKNRSYSWDQKATRAWISKGEFGSSWMRTKSGLVSLKLDAFKEFFDTSHSYPTNCFGSQMVRYLTLRQQLNGFIPAKTGKKKNNFWDNVGSDGRVRPYFGIYGAQSARSQPSATSFLFLKSAWMRSLCQPKEGRAVGGIDYKSEEFLIGGLVSQDEGMIEAYHSGDPYFYFSKLAGEVPWEAQRKDYEEVRTIFKEVTLSLQYGMGKVALAKRLSIKLGKVVSENQAQGYINKFTLAYPIHNKYKESITNYYTANKFIRLPCGWYMWGDNDNDKSVKNVPIQGVGSSIMRKAVALAQDAGLDVILTLHDALYIEFDEGHLKSAMNTLADCMWSAFSHYFKNTERADIGLDGNAWSSSYSDGEVDVGGS